MSRTTWAKVRIWRVFLQLVVINLVLLGLLVHAIVTRNGDYIWAWSIALVLLSIPQLVGFTMMLRREPLRTQLFSRGPRKQTDDAPGHTPNATTGR